MENLEFVITEKYELEHPDVIINNTSGIFSLSKAETKKKIKAQCQVCDKNFFENEISAIVF